MPQDNERDPYAPPDANVEGSAPARGMWRQPVRITELFPLGAIGVLTYIVMTRFAAPWWAKLLLIWALSIPLVPVQRRYYLRRTGGDRSRATWRAAMLEVALVGAMLFGMLDFMLHSGA